MPEKSASNPAREPLSAQAISDYLIANPDFFQEHKKLLTRLSVPHPAGGAVSLVERQVEVLRCENRRLERHQVEWMEIARENDRLLGHLHALAVALLAEPGAAERITVLKARLQSDFEAPAVTLILYGETRAEALPEARHLARDDTAFDGLVEALAANKPFCRPLTAARSERLFPDHAPLASVAWIPLGSAVEGVLVLASPAAKHFHPSLDTAYLARLGQLASAALASAEP
ncbi:MAG: DUF484 family protein [Gammaproteobacteria bacterium]